jgi:hypothetical protein
MLYFNSIQNLKLQLKVFNNCSKEGVFVAFDDIKLHKIDHNSESIKCLNLTSSNVQTNEFSTSFSTDSSEHETTTMVSNNTSTWFEDQTSPESTVTTNLFTDVFNLTSTLSSKTTTNTVINTSSKELSTEIFTTNKQKSENSNRLIIFIAVGSALLLVLLIIFIFFYLKCKKMKSKYQFGSLQLKDFGDNI